MKRLVLEAIVLMAVACVGAAIILVVGSRGPVSLDRDSAAVAPPGTPATQAAPGAPPLRTADEPSPETVAYLEWLRPKAQLAVESLRAIGTQTDQVAQNPVLLGDDGWKVRTATAVEILRFTGQEIQAYPGRVPQAALKLDGMNKEIGQDLVYIATEYSASVDQLSVPRLRNAIARANAIRPRAEAAAAEADALDRKLTVRTVASGAASRCESAALGTTRRTDSRMSCPTLHPR